MPFPTGTTWGPDSYIVAAVIHDLVAPNGQMFLFPNNNLDDRYYYLSTEEKEKVKQGDFSPITDRHLAALVENEKLDKLSLTIGRSFGGSLVASFGSRATDFLEINANAIDEPPNTYSEHKRSAIELRKSMTRERKDTIPAIKSAGLDVLNEAKAIDKSLEYQRRLLRYVIGSNVVSPNVSINEGFRSDSFYRDLLTFLKNSETATISVSNANDSTVSSSREIESFIRELNLNGQRVNYLTYEGRHVTAGNPFVLGTLALKALEFHESHGNIQ